MLKDIDDLTKQVLDVVAGGTAVATFFEYLPDATAILAFIWLLIRVWESDTIQRLIRRKRQ